VLITISGEEHSNAVLTSGQGMVKNLVEKANLDKPLLIYNRSSKRSHDLEQTLPSGKVKVAQSVADGVAKSDVIMVCLSNDAAVEEVFQEIAKGDVKGKLFVDSSTVHPDTTAKLAWLVVGQGAEFVAVPVFGAPAMADAGKLIAVMAGPKSSVEKIRPYYKGVMARAEIDMAGEKPEKATLMKIVGNTFIMNMVEQLSEGMVLGEKSGLGTKYVQEFVDTMFDAPYSAYAKRLVSGDYYQRDEPLMSVNNARKDAGHALAIAKKNGVKLPNTETADAHLADAAKKYGGDKADLAGIYGAVRQDAGLKFENDA
jgi:3-hydroxyisobutyrate dehydrogenase-like beta-hydroxyacid dehydrogenase